MHSLLVLARDYVASHPLDVVVYTSLALMGLVAQLPARFGKLPVVGYFVRFVDRVSVLAHKDAPGTLKWPGVPSILLAAAIDVATGRDRASKLPPLPLAMLLALTLGACTTAQGQSVALSMDKARAVVRQVCQYFGQADALVPQHYGVADASVPAADPTSSGGTASLSPSTTSALADDDAGSAARAAMRSLAGLDAGAR